MKFKNNKELRDYITTLLDKNELNLSISDILSSLLGNREITYKKEIELLMNRYHFSSHTVFLGRVAAYLDIDLSVEDNLEIFNQYVTGVIHELDPSKYLNNPYYLAINGVFVKEKDYEIKEDKYTPFEIFAYQDMKEEDYIEINSLGYFKDEFSFITLNHKGVTWMNITPNEIETMEKAVNEAKGDVLVFGLGLGYFPFMALLKNEVKSVTVIENDKTIIDLFNKHLKPKFPHQEKLNIIYDDANNYLSKDLKADYVFVDLWHNPEDGIEFFLKFKETERKQKGAKFFYWLESSFYLFLRRCMFALIAEQLEGDNPQNYVKAETVEDKIINSCYQQTKNLFVETKEDLDNLLRNRNLVDLLLNHR